MSDPNSATVSARLSGGSKSAYAVGQRPRRFARKHAPNRIVSTAKMATNIRRKTEIPAARDVVMAQPIAAAARKKTYMSGRSAPTTSVAAANAPTALARLFIIRSLYKVGRRCALMVQGLVQVVRR